MRKRRWSLGRLGEATLARSVHRWLNSGSDVFYLSLSDLPRAIAGVDMSAVAAAGKAELAYYETIDPPPIIVGRFERTGAASDKRPDRVERLSGLPASAGVATGPARVVERPVGGLRIRPGEILIARYTDPGWTPYFLTAAGIVMDVGGMLSHGSIIAREYGIPAVVNVGLATKVISTGQMVRVDGNAGVVPLLDRA